MYEARLTPKSLLEYRYIGGVKVFATHWTTFDERDVNMDEVSEFADQEFIDLKRITKKPGRPPKEVPEVEEPGE